MKSIEEIQEFSRFLAEYSACLLGSGVHTSRVMRNSARIADSMDLKITMTTLQKSIVLTVTDEEKVHTHTEVIQIPGLPINFEYNSELSSLSWKAYDGHLTLAELWTEFERIKSSPKMNKYLITFLVGLANAAFCRLFAGDWVAFAFVFIATIVGFFLRLQLQSKGVNHFIVFTVSAFVASFIASFTLFINGVTSEIAIATSVLYLIPGVPLINGVIDVLEGHTLTGGSRLVQAFLLIVCIAVGLAASLLLFQNDLL